MERSGDTSREKRRKLQAGGTARGGKARQVSRQRIGEAGKQAEKRGVGGRHRGAGR